MFGPAGPPTEAHGCSMPIGRAYRPSYMRNRVNAAHRDDVGTAAAATSATRARAPCEPAAQCSGLPALLPEHTNSGCQSVGPTGPPARLTASLNRAPARGRSDGSRDPMHVFVEAQPVAIRRAFVRAASAANCVTHDHAPCEPAAQWSGLPALLPEHTNYGCRSVGPAGPPACAIVSMPRIVMM